MNEEPIFPMGIFIYDSEGFHRGATWVRDNKQLNAAAPGIARAINERREVRITDPSDRLLFHSYRGCVKWNGKEKHECANCQEKEKQ